MRMEMTRRATALEPARWGIQLGIVRPLGGEANAWHVETDAQQAGGVAL